MEQNSDEICEALRVLVRVPCALFAFVSFPIYHRSAFE